LVDSWTSTGIGYAIVEQLAAHGAKVYLGARSEKRARAAIKKIEDAHPEVRKNGLVIWLPLDLTEPADVIESAKDFMRREQRLDILGEKKRTLIDVVKFFELTKLRS
jgi:NAD(P)-dependent dehydrogenase (short-subunit alcohol dehydrogenase family)